MSEVTEQTFKAMQALSAEELQRVAQRLMSRARPPAEELLKRGPRSGRIPLSLWQEGLWVMEHLGVSGSAAYNQSLAFRLLGALDVPVLEAAVAEMLVRHEVLRTRIVSDGGEPRQIIAEPGRFSLKSVDLTALSESGRQSELQRHLNAQMTRPFDWAKGLCRASLVKLSDDEHVFVWIVHHVIWDGWSSGMFLGDLAYAYTAFKQGKAMPPLPADEPQYADYAIWQRQRATPEAIREHLDYWKQALANAPETVNLPTDRPYGAEPDDRGGRVEFQIDEALATRLRERARDEGVTLFMLVLATFQIWLSREARQSDVSVGSPIAGRTPDTLGMIGFFSHVLVMRARLEERATFTAVLQQVKARVLQAFEHQEMPFEKLVSELRPGRSPGRPPIFQVFFALHSFPGRGRKLRMHDLEVKQLPIPDGQTKYELAVHMLDSPTSFSGWMEYRAALFDAATVERWVKDWRVVMSWLVENPTRPLEDLPNLRVAP